jgi:hypothetical protein
MAVPAVEELAEATPENTGPGAMLVSVEQRPPVMLEVIDERRRKVKMGERTLTILERRVLDVGKSCFGKDSKGWLVERRGAWKPMHELRGMRVVRGRESPAAAAG